MSIELNAQERRRLLRIAIGSSIGFLVCKLMGWPYGVFFTVYPMLLLGMLPRFDALIGTQFVLGTALNALEAWFLCGVLSPYPLVMTIAVLLVYCFHFRLMAATPYFLLGATGLVTLSTLLHFSSYHNTAIMDMVTATLLASVLSVASAALCYFLVPEPEPLAPPAPARLSAAQINHRTLLGALLGTVSFVVFQVFDLRDSLSAQVATMLVLFPMTYQGTVQAGWKRAKGVAIGCLLAVVMQVLLYDLIDHFVLVTLALFLTVMLTAWLHLVERGGSGMGFGALTTIGILFGQYLKPDKGIIFGAAYRLASVSVAILTVVALAYLLAGLLNRFALTREQ